jgi:CarboxypepD_reg-like domain
MRKKVTLLLVGLLVTLTGAMAQNTGTLKGKVTDKDTKQPLPFVNVILFLNGNLITGGATDIDGEYTIKPH